MSTTPFLLIFCIFVLNFVIGQWFGGDGGMGGDEKREGGEGEKEKVAWNFGDWSGSLERLKGIKNGYQKLS